MIKSMEKNEKTTGKQRLGFCERWKKKLAEREVKTVKSEVLRRLQVRECWGTLYISFDGLPLLSIADLEGEGFDIPANADLCDLLACVRGNAESYMMRKRQGYDD